MKSVFKWILRALGVLPGLIVLLLVVAFFVVNSNSFQQRMLDRAVTLLEEKLQTRVAIDSVNVDLWTLDAALFGLCIEDRQQRPMLARCPWQVRRSQLRLLVYQHQRDAEDESQTSCLLTPLRQEE